MARPYRPTLVARMGNVVATGLIRSGLNVGLIALLTVQGRKSGRPRTTPIAVVEREGRRYLVATFGIVDWVRNVRAAGEATLTRGRRAERVRVIELSPAEAAPILKACLASGPGFVRSHFDVTPDSSLDDFAREAVHHPVFEVSKMD